MGSGSTSNHTAMLKVHVSTVAQNGQTAVDRTRFQLTIIITILARPYSCTD